MQNCVQRMGTARNRTLDAMVLVEQSSQTCVLRMVGKRKVIPNSRAGQHCRRKAIHSPAYPTHPRYLKIPLLRNGGQEETMQRGFMQRVCRKRGPDVWQFRWSEIGPDGKRTHHKKVVGTVEQYADEHSARQAVVGLIKEINADPRLSNSRAITIAELGDHFEQLELTQQNTWRSHATKKIYKAYLNRWVRPHWQRYTLAEVRTIQVESWLRTLPLARSSCAKIRNLMSVLFNHACRYELFDRNPIYLVGQSAKRRKPPIVLLTSEVNNLELRKRTLVLLAASTGLRQSEIFGLKWGDIDFAQRAMSVTRSIAYGVVGPCKTESSQKPVPLHSTVAHLPCTHG
jgi:integrase